MTPRKAVEQELSRDTILEAARALFLSQGYSQVSMRQIAKTLGYSHGAIYYHFHNKAELFHALVAKDFSKLDDKLAEVLALDIPNDKKLRQVLLGFIQFGLDHPSHYEVMFLTRDPELKGYLNREPNASYEKFAQALFKLCSSGPDIKSIWSTFLSLHGFVAQYCDSGQTFHDMSAMAEAHVDFVLKGLGEKQ